MNLPHVFAKTTAVVSEGGHPARVQAGSHWLADDPVVLAHPDLFSEDCRYGLAYSGTPPECLTVPPEDDHSSAAMTSRVQSKSKAERARAGVQ